MNKQRTTCFRFVFVTLTILSAAFCSVLWAQDCVPDDITLSSQSDVDNFQVNHGPCDRGVGNLYISGPDIVNLGGLTSLTSVNGILSIRNSDALTNLNGLSSLAFLFSLEISFNDAMTSLDGLSNLTNVAGLIIKSNIVLTNIDGLSALVSVGNGFLSIDYNPSLTNINGLSGLTSLGTSYIINNDKLTNLDGLSGITSVNWGDLHIRGNAALTNLDGLSSLTEVTYVLDIDFNHAMTNIDGLSSLAKVGEDLRITAIPLLTNVDGLSSLTRVGGNLQLEYNTALTNIDGLSAVISVAGDLNISRNESLSRCKGLSRLIDQWDAAEPGPGPGDGGVPDVGRNLYIEQNLAGCNSVQEIMATVNPSKINPGLNDAWYNPETSGQGFFITVFPDLSAVSLAWFTYDTQLPPLDATANLGDPGHRWITAVGPIEGNQVMMGIVMTSGGLFDTATEITRTDPPGSDGTIVLTFDSCNSGTVEYDIPSINKQGIVPIQRVANDNIVICEALNAD